MFSAGDAAAIVVAFGFFIVVSFYVAHIDARVCVFVCSNAAVPLTKYTRPSFLASVNICIRLAQAGLYPLSEDE